MSVAIDLSLFYLYLIKFFENVVHDSLGNHMHNIISGNQHGFLRCRSTISNLACYLDSIFESIHKTNTLILFTWTLIMPLIQCATHC